MTLKTLRWVLLLLFPWGYFTVVGSLGNQGPRFLLLTIVDAAACGLLLSRLAAPLRENLWAWISLAFLLDGYFYRFYDFAGNINHSTYIATNYPELRWVDAQRLLAAFPWASAGFSVFCVAAFVALMVNSRTRPTHVEDVNLGSCRRVVVATVIGYLMLSYFQYRLQYGYRGIANPSLPLGLGHLLLFFREQAVVAILVMAIWIFDVRDPKWARYSTAALALCGVVASLISSSRSELLTFTFPIFVLWAVTKRFTRRRIMGALGIVLLALLLVPVVSSQRLARITHNQNSSAHRSVFSLLTIQSALSFGINEEASGQYDSVLYALDDMGHPSLDRTITFLRPGVMTAHYTYDLVGVQIPNDYRTAGVFGAFMIIGGSSALVIGTILLVAIFAGTWAALGRFRFASVANALAALSISTIIANPTAVLTFVPKLALQLGVCVAAYGLLRARKAPMRSGPLPASASRIRAGSRL